jgi:crotonobetainyl-CoA:carnitine CoA-transferase CaiB-like acyl-CoA transferase
MTSQPLADVSVLELSTMIAGPYAGQMLGDMGADVVKIERPGEGELARGIEPKFGRESFYYLTANRNKRSLALDVTSDEGRELFYELAERVDVVLLNFPPAFAERYDVDYDSIREQNDDVIYCSISAFGTSGPYSEYNGVDTTIQALSGSMSMARTEETPPMRSGFPFADVCASLYAVQGILSSLINRYKNDCGEFIDVSLLDGVIAGLTTRATYSLATDEPYPPFGRHHNYFAPEGTFEAADGDVQLSVITDRHWQRFCEALDAPELAADDRFEALQGRIEHNDDCRQAVADEIAEWAVEEIVTRLREVAVPVAPLNDTDEVWEDPQVQAREMLRTMSHPDLGDIDTLGFPVKYCNLDQEIERHPPRLGEHTREILRTAGYDDATIDELVEENVLEDFGS